MGAHTGLVHELSHRRHVDTECARMSADGTSDGVLAGSLHGRRPPQHLVVAVLGHRLDGEHLHHAGGDGACLVEHHCVDPPRALEHFRALDEHTHLCAATRAHQQRGRRGQAQRTWAGDDEHRHGRPHRLAEAAGAPEPKTQGGHCKGHHHGHEYSGHAVGQALHRGFPTLCPLDQASHLREGGIGPHAGGTHHEPTIHVDGGPGDGIAHGHIAGNTFARHQ